MEYKDINDYELLYMVSDGTDEMMEFLLEKYEPFLLQKCDKWKSIVIKLHIGFDDLEQEVRVAFLDAIKKYREEENASFYTFVSSVVDTRIKNIIRKEMSDKNKSIVESVSLSEDYLDKALLDFIPDEKIHIEQDVEISEISSAIEKFLIDLPFEKACMLELFISGYSFIKIAEILGYSEKTIYAKLGRLRKKLKDYLLNLGLVVV